MSMQSTMTTPSPITTISEIGKHDGQTVTLRGWLYNLRESGKLLFPIFRDGSGVIQGVLPKNAVPPEVFDAVKGLTQESSVIVEGKVRADKRAPGGYELDVTEVQVVQRVSETDPYPITPKEHGVDFLMERRHLWVRSPRQASILRVRAEIVKAVRDFFDERGFTLTDPPILTPAACEGTSTLFPVDYFDEQAYATLDDLMDLAEGLVTFVVQRCLERRRPDLAVIGRDVTKLEKVEAPFPRITYDEAVQMLQEGHAQGALEHKFEWGGDLGSPDETYLAQKFDRPVMVHRYPAKVKAFYMEPDPLNPKAALCVDVLAPEGYGEIIGGSQRMSSYELLVQRIHEHGLP